MKRIVVPVQFTGTVTVLVPSHLAAADAQLLAHKVALAQVLATTDNPDAPEEDAQDDYQRECQAKVTAEQDWDRCKIVGVGGSWSHG